jgi:hypothetical protein
MIRVGGAGAREVAGWCRRRHGTFKKRMRVGEIRTRTSVTGIHSYIYGIDGDAVVRKITVSKEARATVMILNPPHGSAAAPVRTIVQNDRAPLQEAKRMFGLDDAVEVPADLDESAVGEKVRADLEVRAVARKEA